MKKSEFKNICKEFNVIPKAVKNCLKAEDLKVKDASEYEVIKHIYVNAPTLMFSRDTGDGSVEYQDKDNAQKLLDRLATGSSNTINSF